MKLWLEIKSFDEIVQRYLLNPDSKYQLKETDRIGFEIEFESLENYQPELKMSDVPIHLEKSQDSDGIVKFRTSFFRKYRHFEHDNLVQNYFGEVALELLLTSSEGEEIVTEYTLDILARARNVEMAEQMLKYIEDNYETLIASCFSRSRKGAESTNLNKPSFQAHLRAIETILLCFERHTEKLSMRPHHTYSQEICWLPDGSPTGPDAICEMQKHLDTIGPSSSELADLRYQNRYYQMPLVPQEVLEADTNTYENRVLHTSMKRVQQVLSEIKRDFQTRLDTNFESIKAEGFVQFDHVISKFSGPIIRAQFKEVCRLEKRTFRVLHTLNRYLPAKSYGNEYPKMTAFVKSAPHYRALFLSINYWYQLGELRFGDKPSIMLGLRNLSSLYEFVVLGKIIQAYKNFGFKLDIKDYRMFGQGIPFSGNSCISEDNKMSNYYKFSVGEKGDFTVEIWYEPKIYGLNPHSEIGDPINISSGLDRYKKPHYLSPDYVMKFSGKFVKRDSIAILDAKYMDDKNVLKYALPDLVAKYLIGLRQYNGSNELSLSPVQLVYAVYPHGSEESPNYHANRHQLNGKYAAPPFIGSRQVRPDNGRELDELIKNFISHILPSAVATKI
ncbi:DUF2357 domain-containing protein [Vibrio caribbeanicus]|uniref:DUF2357 domain-containing protein n=1 Tax=Vibrio caribbeanicus TaxID=701175 RepID=UPI002284E900|nr:DUF2357 domain-containing protein [Vibrio caribbeanicus]MCY9846064.1 DUF2357 domain-containing protein [Vibrio caribbeanicus]